MEIIPAIDIRQGRCVRLYQGDYSRETVYGADPSLVARRWKTEGAARIHVVDLDGAARGEPQNLETIKAILRSVGVPLQLGGGIRSGQVVEALLDLGIDRVVLGTAAVENPELVGEVCWKFGERVVVGIDARDGMVASHGWMRSSAITAVDMALKVMELGARRIIYTDIGRDGTLTSPNFAALGELQSRVVVPVIASGGVSSLAHVTKLASMGVEGVIIGKALYAGEVRLPDALAAAGKEKVVPHKFEVSKIDRLDSAERLSRLPAFEEVFSVIPLKAFHRVADIGCGTGVFSLPLAQRLPQGKVFCLDIAEEMLERVRKKVSENKVSNIEVRRSGETELGLEPGTLDGVFMAFVLHEQEDRVAFLTAVRKALKSEGWVAVLDWAKKEMKEGPPLIERIDPSEVIEFGRKAGLKSLTEKALGDRFYMLVFTNGT